MACMDEKVRVHYYVLQSKNGPVVLLEIPVGSGVYFKGKLLLKRVISGAIECLGYEVSENDTKVKDLAIYSPRGYSLLRLRSVIKEPLNAVSRKIDDYYLQRFGIKDDVLAGQISGLNLDTDPQELSLVILERFDTPWTKVLDDHLPHCGNNSNTKFKLFKRDPVGPGLPLIISQESEICLNVNCYENEEALEELSVRARIYRPNPE